jgi:arylsulfatase A-like enzyme/Tfp pilus assembly protein PilF
MRLATHVAVMAAAVLTGVGSPIASGHPPPGVAASTGANLLLVTIDTLRADHVGAYGAAAGITPAIDRLAQEGVLLHDAVAHVPQTRPSHTSLFTGRLPYEHGIRDNFSPPLDTATPTLATLLKQRGYATGGFIGAYPVSRDSGLQRGFDVYDDPFVAASSVATRQDRSERRGREVVDRALEWLERPRTGPFFVWVHLFDPHAPYDPPAPFAGRFPKDPYSGEVAFADSQVGRLLKWLDDTGRRRSTLVVVTSDHGEGLGDHGEEEHGFFVYESTVHVPLVMRWPGGLPAAKRVDGQFREVDLLPTLLELLGAPATPTSGVSRAAVLRAAGRVPDNEAYLESLYASLHFGCAPLRALRSEGWKYIDAPRAELYRLTEDRGESRNRMADRAGVADALRTRLLAQDRGVVKPSLPAGDTAAMERLAALGYAAGGFFSGAPTGTDPKDKIQEFQSFTRDVSRGVRLFERRDYEGAARLLERLATPTPLPGGQVVERRSFNVEYFLGRSLLELRRFDGAVAPLSRAVDLNPAAVPAYAYLSRAQAGAGRTEDAAATVERGLRIAPRNAELHQMRGRLQLAAGDRVTARSSLERARELDPQNALVRVDLTTLYRSQGEIEAALREGEEAVRLAPTLAEAQVALGLALGASGREREAGDAFRAALRAHPDDPDALFFLGSVELRAGQPEKAKPLLARLVAKAPGYPGAKEALASADRAASGPAEGGLRFSLIRVRERSRAEEVVRRLAAGEEFSALARAMSDDASAAAGGALGAVRLADLVEPLRSTATALKPGQVSDVLETTAGFVLLRREP